MDANKEFRNEDSWYVVHHSKGDDAIKAGRTKICIPVVGAMSLF